VIECENEGFGGRSANSVKNRWYKRLCKLETRESSPKSPKTEVEEQSKKNNSKREMNLSHAIGITDDEWSYLVRQNHQHSFESETGSGADQFN
jgi:hypothetical protein